MGSLKKPLIVRVQTEERALEVMQECQELGLHVLVGIEPDKPEDMTDVERALHPVLPVHVEKIGRNEACPCGSGKKYKKCCGAGTGVPL
nr:PBPRA1643 family SWIM/SEC-C metal-binding motif protein [uncultured Noviherbaspirillum sp.]